MIRQYAHEGYVGGGVSEGGGEPEPEPEGGVGPFAVNLWILAGQSNAEGNSLTSTLSAGNLVYTRTIPGIRHARESDCPKGYNSVAVCNFIQSFAALSPHNGVNLGPELSLLRRLRDRFGGQHALVTQATNGTALKFDWDPAGVGSGTRLFDRMVTFVNAKLAQLPVGSGIAGIVWVQGESDADNELVAVEYQSRLTAFIAACRAAFGAAVPFVLNRLSVLYPGSANATVRAAQTAVAAAVPGVVMVDSDDLTMRDVDTHFDANSLIILGERLADAMPTPTVPDPLGRQYISLEDVTSGSSTTDTTAYPTASITPRANRLHVIAISNSELTTNPSPPTSVVGGGITFTKVQDLDYDLVSAAQNVSVWIGSTASPSAGVVTITYATGQTSCCWSVSELGAGLDLASPVVQSRTVGPTNSAVLSASLLSAPSHSHNLLFAAFAADASNLNMDPLGYAIHTVTAASPVTRLSTEYYVGQQTAIGTINAAANWGAIVIEFSSSTL